HGAGWNPIDVATRPRLVEVGEDPEDARGYQRATTPVPRLRSTCCHAEAPRLRRVRRDCVPIYGEPGPRMQTEKTELGIHDDVGGVVLQFHGVHTRGRGVLTTRPRRSARASTPHSSSLL